MKRGIVLSILVVVTYILHTSVFSFLKLANVVPNISLVLVSGIALLRGQKEGMTIGFFIGLLLDIFTNSVIGPFAFLYMVIGFIDGFFHKDYYSDEIFLPMIIIAVTDLAYGVVMYVASMALNNHLNIGYYLIHTILPEMIYTAAVGILLYKIIVKINDWLETGENVKSRISS